MKDVIKIGKTKICLNFKYGELQSISLFNLNENITFAIKGTELVAYLNGNNQEILINSFSSENHAKNAYQNLEQKINKYYERKFILEKAKSFSIVSGIILIFLMLNGLLANTTSKSEKLTSETSTFSQPPTPALLPSALQSPEIENRNTQTLEEQKNLADGLADGVKSGKFSVTLNKGTKGELYVFSDPLCSHCKAIEPELEKLKDYTIHIFPVTVIGKTSSATLVSSVLCAKNDERPEIWKKAISGTLSANSCTNGDKAFNANDQIFRTMQFPGTPQLIAKNGKTPSPNVEFNAESIAKFLAENQ